MASLAAAAAPPDGGPSPPRPSGLRLSNLLPLVTGIVTLAGPPYPLGLLIEARHFHDVKGLSVAAAWDAAFIVPTPQVVLQGIRYAVAPSILALVLLGGITACVVILGLHVLPWTRSSDNSIVRSCGSWLERAVHLGASPDHSHPGGGRMGTYIELAHGGWVLARGRRSGHTG